MFRIPRRNPWPPVVDLGTVRETLSYMKDDMQRVPGLERVASAIEATLKEIDRARPPSPVQPLTPIAARFMPRRP